MNEKAQRILKSLDPFKGIIYFLFLLFFFHFAWKLSIEGDSDSDFILLWGHDITPDWFHTICLWLTQAASWVVHQLPGGGELVRESIYMWFPDGGITIRIIWGCTGVKQLFIFSCIMLFYRGPFLKKLWYIPLGWLLLTLYNILRIALITYFTNGHPERFDSLHDGIFRYIYYALIFLLWVCWEELIVKKRLNNEHKREADATA